MLYQVSLRFWRVYPLGVHPQRVLPQRVRCTPKVAHPVDRGVPHQPWCTPKVAHPISRGVHQEWPTLSIVGCPISSSVHQKWPTPFSEPSILEGLPMGSTPPASAPSVSAPSANTPSVSALSASAPLSEPSIWEGLPVGSTPSVSAPSVNTPFSEPSNLNGLLMGSTPLMSALSELTKEVLSFWEDRTFLMHFSQWVKDHNMVQILEASSADLSMVCHIIFSQFHQCLNYHLWFLSAAITKLQAAFFKNQTSYSLINWDERRMTYSFFFCLYVKLNDESSEAVHPKKEWWVWKIEIW